MKVLGFSITVSRKITRIDPESGWKVSEHSLAYSSERGRMTLEDVDRKIAERGIDLSNLVDKEVLSRIQKK